MQDGPGGHITDVAAFGDGFVAVGQVDSRAAAWVSDDGITWTRSDVQERGEDSVFPVTIIASIAIRGDVVVGFGSATDYGSGYVPGDDTTEGIGEPVAWTTADGVAWEAHAVAESRPGTIRYGWPVVATDDEFIAFAQEVTASGGRQWEYRSTDGVTWIGRELDLPGERSDAAYADGTAVAVGESNVWVMRDR